jgi:hypothetical protein
MLRSAKHPFDIDHKNGQCRYIQKKFVSGRPASFEGSLSKLGWCPETSDLSLIFPLSLV